MKLYVVTYGIACFEEEDGKRELIAEIPSATSNFDEIRRIVKICNEGNLSPDQLKDVVEDLIHAI